MTTTTSAAAPARKLRDRAVATLNEFLGQHSNFKSHARCIRLKDLQERNLGLKVSSARTPIELHRRIWDVYCAIDVVFATSGIFKLFYNSRDEAIVRAAQPAFAPMLMQPPPSA